MIDTLGNATTAQRSCSGHELGLEGGYGLSREGVRPIDVLRDGKIGGTCRSIESLHRATWSLL